MRGTHLKYKTVKLAGKGWQVLILKRNFKLKLLTSAYSSLFWLIWRRILNWLQDGSNCLQQKHHNYWNWRAFPFLQFIMFWPFSNVLLYYFIVRQLSCCIWILYTRKKPEKIKKILREENISFQQHKINLNRYQCMIQGRGLQLLWGIKQYKHFLFMKETVQMRRSSK